MMLGQHSKALRADALPQETVSWEQNFPESKETFEPEREAAGAAARLLRQWLEAGKDGVEIRHPSPQPGNLAFKK